MERIPNIMHEDIPCWYELSWNGESRAILLRVHSSLIETSQSIAEEDNPIQALKKEFGFKEFSGDLEGDFGFERAFKFKGVKEHGFLLFEIPLPKIMLVTKEKCLDCKGKRKLNGFLCFYCKGSGKKINLDFYQAHAISASFTVFTRYLAALYVYGGGKSNSPFPQLLTIETITMHGPHGGSLSGVFSKILVEWLSHIKPHTQIYAAKEAMKTAYHHFFEKHSYEDWDFTARSDNTGRLLMTCPGDACGIHPGTGGYREERSGYTFTCHNVDSSPQQLTFLAGLAALHDVVRKKTV